MKKRYFIFLISFLAIIFVVWSILWIKLSNYQKEVDFPVESYGIGDNSENNDNGINYEMLAQDTFSDYIENMTLEDWLSIYKISFPDSIDSDEDIVSIVQSKVIPYKNNRYKAMDYTEDNPTFIIGSREKAVASFKFVRELDKYSLKEAKIFETGDESITINAYSNSTIEINGQIFEGQETSNNQITVEDCDDLLIEPITVSTYVIEGVINPDVDINVENSYKTFDNNYYCISDENDDLMGRSEDFVRALLKYYSQGKNNISGNMGAVLSHVDSSSPAAKVIRNTESGLEWVTPDDSISMEVSSSPACILAKNCLFTEVNCECGNIYRVYFLRGDNEYRIVQFSCVL